MGKPANKDLDFTLLLALPGEVVLSVFLVDVGQILLCVVPHSTIFETLEK